MIMKPKLGDKVRIKTKLEGDKLCVIDWLNISASIKFNINL
ncbi:MAG: hypothetical protein RL308_2895 [Bacteroidota bacterium]|jgi:hypothetical protein